MTATLFNFRKPGPLPCGLAAPLSRWLGTACALATKRWGQSLPFAAEVHVRASDHEPAADALAELPEPAIGYPLTLQDRLNTLMVWPRPVALGIVAALMGDAALELPADRELTLVEESLFEMFLRELLLPSFLETWRGMQALKPVLGTREPFPRWAKLFTPDESVIVTSLLLKAPFGVQEGRWVMPLKGMQENLDPERGPARQTDASAAKPRLEALVQELPVQMTVVLGSVELPLSQLAGLRPGDVILLDQRVSQPLAVWVQGQKKMQGWPGRSGSQQAVRIESFEK